MTCDLAIIHPSGVHGIYGELGESLVAREPPLWPRLIAGYMLDRDHKVTIFDQEALQISSSDLAEMVKVVCPKLVAIVVSGHQPSASTQAMPGAREVALAIREIIPDQIIIMTGNHPSALPERTLREEIAIDYVCDGEGPVTIEGLLRGDNLKLIPGLVWRSTGPSPLLVAPGAITGETLGDGYQVIRNPLAPLLDLDRDLHGRAWHLLPMERYRSHNWQCLDDLGARQPYAAIYTSLGCPYKCLSGDTEVNTIYGKIPIKTLAAWNVEIPVFTFDPETKTGSVATARTIRQYGENQRLVRVNFDDGTHLDCTPDHQFLQFKWNNRRGESKQWACEAQNLKPGAHVRALRLGLVGKSNRQYPSASWSRKGRNSIHRMVAAWKIGRELLPGEEVHHRDLNKLNYDPTNLNVYASHADHQEGHPEIAQRMRENNPAKNMTPEWRAKIQASTIGLKRSDASKERYRAAAYEREAKVTRVWWTEPDGSTHMSVGPRDPEARRGRNAGVWWTNADGSTYQANEPKNPSDHRGRRGFNSHQAKGPINHRVTSVEPLEGTYDVYCLEVPATGWFYANDVLVKNCSFCMINTAFHGNKYRMRDPVEVVKEIKFLYETYGVQTFKFVDEMFVLNQTHVNDICVRLMHLKDHTPGFDPNIWAYARIDTVNSQTQLDLLRDAGFRWLALGIESGSAEVRDGADKRLKTEDIVGTVRRVQAAEISVIGNFMFGLRDDTEESMSETALLALECLPEWANFYSTQAYPGSALYDQAIKENWTLPETWAGYSQHNEHCRPLDTKYVKGLDVLAMRDETFINYFTHPRYLAMLERKFGPAAIEHVRSMTQYKLKRRLLEGEIA